MNRCITAFTVCMLMSRVADAQFSWEPTSGPPCGATPMSLGFGQGDTVFMVTDGAGLYRSNNYGKLWRSINSGVEKEQMSCTLVAGNGDVLVGSQNRFRIWRSTNRGASWMVSMDGIPASSDNLSTGMFCALPSGEILVTSVSIAPSAVGMAVYRSSDNGYSWLPSSSGLPKSGIRHIESFDASTGGRVVASTDTGLYISSDAGRTWAMRNPPSLPFGMRSAFWAGADEIYALANMSGALLHSTNAGETWAGLPIDPRVTRCTMDKNRTLIFSGTGVLWYSKDNGAQMTIMSSPAERGAFTCGVDSSNRLYASTDERGIVTTTDLGASWTFTTNSILGATVTAVASDTSGVLIAGTSHGRLFRSTDRGDNWINSNQSNIAVAHVSRIIRHPAGILFAIMRTPPSGVSHGLIYASTDGGGSWQLRSADTKPCEFRDIVALRSGTLLACSSIGVHRSFDTGATWNVIPFGLVDMASFNSITEWSQNGNILLASTIRDGIFSSSDDGMNWKPSNIGIAQYGVRNILTTKRGRLLAAMDVAASGCYYSDDGRQWKRASGIPTTCNIARIGSNALGHSYAVSDHGVWFSRDDGTTWEIVNTGLGSNSVTDITFSDSGFAFISAEANGVYRSSTSTYHIIPAPSVLAFPSDTSVDLNPSLTFAWHHTELATSYQFQLSLDSKFKQTEIDEIGISDTMYSPRGLLYDRKYYWRVRANNPYGWGGWSRAWSFTTNIEPPQVITLISPTNGWTNAPVNLEFYWQLTPRAELYQTQIALDPEFKTIAWENDSLTYMNAYVFNLIPITRYFWRVRASNRGGIGPWSPTWHFSTEGNVTSAPNLLSPASGASVCRADTNFNWTEVQSAQHYHICFSKDSTFLVTITECTVMGNSSNIRIPVPFARLFWRVRAGNSIGEGPWSPIWSITANPSDTTHVVVAVSPLRASSYRIALDQNYPNPFRDVTMIRFTLQPTAQGSSIATQLVIEDLLGRRCTTILDERLKPGDHAIPFSARAAGLAAGSYILRLSTSNQSISRMISITP
jgi:photosystem II stability/assembly factor-like uncharacterized protein